MNKFLLIIFALIFVLSAAGQSKNEQHMPVVKMDTWSKSDEAGSNVQTIAEGITYYTTSEGIYLTLPKATNNVKLFALTGEVVWQGNLVQGRFFIPTRRGIYFLRINNKNYKVVCK